MSTLEMSSLKRIPSKRDVHLRCPRYRGVHLIGVWPTLERCLLERCPLHRGVHLRELSTYTADRFSLRGNTCMSILAKCLHKKHVNCGRGVCLTKVMLTCSYLKKLATMVTLSYKVLCWLMTSLITSGNNNTQRKNPSTQTFHFVGTCRYLIPTTTKIISNIIQFSKTLIFPHTLNFTHTLNTLNYMYIKYYSVLKNTDISTYLKFYTYIKYIKLHVH